MKTTPNIRKGLFTAITIASLTLTMSCKKSDATSSSTTATEADAVELTTDAMVPLNGGMVTQVSSATNLSQTVTLTCGVEKDSTITKASITGATPTYSYSLAWKDLLSCSTGQLTFNFTGTSSYNGVNMSSNDNSTGVFVLSGIQPSATAYTMNATYTRNGSQTSKIGRTFSFTSNLTIQASNLMINKTTQAILSGSGTVAITGNSTSGNSFSFNGTITFLGANKATLVLNSGTSYALSW